MQANKPNYPELLQKFCDDGQNRPNLAKPFIGGDWVYATDSFQMCRMKKDIFTTEELEKFTQTCVIEKSESFFDELAESGQSTKTATLPLFETTPDMYKEEAIKEKRECHRCGGSGQINCPYCGNDDAQCTKCDGTGKEEITTGHTRNILHAYFSFYTTWIAGYYYLGVNDLAKGMGLGEIQVIVSPNPLNALHFHVGSDVQIIIMPVKYTVGDDADGRAIKKII